MASGFVTPTKRKGGALQDLLKQFGSSNSATSATKARRISGQDSAKQARPRAHTSTSEAHAPEFPPSPPAQPFVGGASDSTAEPSQVLEPQSNGSRSGYLTESSEDELAPTVPPKRHCRQPLPAPVTRVHTSITEELKMEKRRRERTEGQRRITRGQEASILESDTAHTEAPAARTRRRNPQPPKLDTARQRLRDDIAQHAKAKANHFFIAHKNLFLPLLPPNNYITRLLTYHDAQPIVQYKHLTEQPNGVKATMKPYQLSGLSYLVYLHNNGFSGILGDEMGLGKTLQTLSLFQYLEERDRDSGASSEELRPYLVICPLSVINAWVTECQKWVPELKVLRFHGAAHERDRLKRADGLKVSKLPEQRSQSYRIFITTYDTFQSEQSWFKTAFIWRYVVLDEGHKIKGSSTQVSRSLRNISSEYRLILTGTPLQNNLVEMWALLAWLYPDVFTENTETLFKESFDLNRGKVNRQTMDDARRLLELIMLRRLKDSVNLGLPPKEEVLLYVPLTPIQRFWYTRLLTGVEGGMLDELFMNGNGSAAAKDPDQLQDTAAVMPQANGTQNSAWRRLMNLVLQLRKCCSHPYLVPGASPEPYYLGEHVIRASGKFILLEKLLRHTVIEQGKKVLIFSGFTHTLDCCEDMLSLIGNHASGRHFKFLRLDGSTARARRNLDIRMFNNVDEYKVMLLSTRAGGLGINLTSAQDVIFLDEDWNPQITLQAEARAHRIGQTKKVTIYKLCTQGTVEEQMMGRIRKKLYLSTKITESMRDIHGGIHHEISEAQEGRPSATDDMPQMDMSQLKSLVRRGAQTLSHPEINIKEMLSWDLDTMMSKCRDKPADPQSNEEGPHVDEEQWLSVMERVECALFEGKRYRRKNASANNILPESINHQDRRKGKNTTVMVDGYAINKESVNCGEWEAVPTLAGKDPRLADVKREKRREIEHEDHCVTCFDGSDIGHMINCRNCPRAYHYDCLGPDYQVKAKGFAGFYCPQHNCLKCGKNTTDAGGLIYRCRWCPNGYCEDCLDWAKTELIGENLPEFEMMGEPAPAGGFYIKCPDCIESIEDGDRKLWMEGMEATYREQYETWIQEQEERQNIVEKQQDAVQEKKSKEQQFFNGVASALAPRDSDSIGSPPAMTDTSLPTPATMDSGVITPKVTGVGGKTKKTKKRATKALTIEENYLEQPKGKRARA